MLDPADYDLEKTADEPPPPPSRGRGPVLWWVAAALLVAALAGAYVWLSRPADDGVAATDVAVAPPPATTDRPLGGDAPTVEVPPLDQSDPLVRSLVESLSAHPRIAAWLATPNLIRSFTVVVENIASGATPARHLRVLRPAEPLRVLERDEEMRIDPRSFARYDGIAAAVASIDAAGAATLYSTLKPRIEEAYRELGHQGPFDAALERALVMLLRTPVVDVATPVVFRGALYGYEDPRLQALTAAQKQFLRMGPANVRVVQGKLREIALALGIPDSRLPPPAA